MALTELSFGGLRALEADEQVGIQYALTADDCYLDDFSVRGRNGYRSVTSAAFGTGSTQLMKRFRPNAYAAGTIVVIGGAIYYVQDPTTDSLSDGTATALSGTFGATAKISGAQLGRYMYLGTDESGIAAKRVKYDFSTVESITPIDRITGQTGATSTPAQYLYSSGTVTFTDSAGGGLAGLQANYQASGWYYASNATAQGLVKVDMGSGQDMSAADWLLVYVSPMDRDSSGVYPIEIAISEDNTTFRVIGTTLTNVRGGSGSPNAIYCSLKHIASTDRNSVRYMRFRSVAAGGSFTTQIAVLGHQIIPAKIGNGTLKYYVSYYNSSTRGESQLSDAVEVNPTPFKPTDYNSLSAWLGTFYYSQLKVNADPTNQPPWVYNFRPESQITAPTANDLVPYAQVTFTVGVSSGTADKIRLYRLTETGIRLVKETTNPGSGSVTITDDQGDLALANALYKPSGTPPPCNAMAAVGGRLIMGGDPANPNRIYISSYVPFAATTDPYPQFPAVGYDEADGWSFDIAPTAAEQVTWLGEGEVGTLYILTNERCLVMPSLTLNSPPYEILRRGVVSRQGAMWAEDQLFWASQDAIYVAKNRSQWEELTKDIRRLYKDWFVPDNTVVLAYQDRKLYAFKGTKYLRFDFVRGAWTRGTLAHTVEHAAWWNEGATQTTGGLSYGLLAQWKLDEATGTTRNDSSGAGLHLTDVFANTSRVSDVCSVNYAADFYNVAGANGSLSRAVSSGNLNLGDTDWEFTGWFRPENSSGSQNVIGRWRSPEPSNAEWWLQYAGAGQYLIWNVRNAADSATTILSMAASSCPINTWHFIRCRHDSVNDRIEVSATPVSASSLSAFTSAAHSGGVAQQGGIFYMGITSIGSYSLVGKLDNWTLHSRLLSTTEATQLFNGGCPKDTLPPSSSLTGQQLWLLTSSRQIGRWQAAATSDMMISASAGTTIPAWVYSTGFFLNGKKMRGRWGFADTSGSVTMSFRTTTSATPTRDKTFGSSGEHEFAFPPDLQGYKWRLNMTGANTIQVKRLMYEVEETDQRGG